jgi:hypothetical protein
MPNRLLASLERHRLEVEHAKILDEVLSDLGEDVPDWTPREDRTIGNEERLRGLPAVGRGVSGAIPGTNPEHELLRREGQRQRRVADTR